MSIYYSDLVHTNLPNNVDNFESFQDVGIKTKPYVDQYLQYVSVGDTVNAAAVIADHPEIKPCLINAESLNKLRDGLLALERMFIGDIENYIINITNERGDWSSTDTYRRNDVVTYEIEGVREVYRCIGDSQDTSVSQIPVGTLPTDTRYWSKVTLRGPQGVSGSGLAPRGAWNSTITYSADDLVVYNDAWWVATESNLNETPSDSSTKWIRYFEYRQQISVSDTQPENQLAGEMWFRRLSNGIWSKQVKTPSGYTKIVPRTIISATLPSSSWSIENNQVYQTISNSNLRDATGGIVYLSPSASADQREAARGAQLVVGSKSSDLLTLYVDGSTPSVDIPIVIEINDEYPYFCSALPGGGGKSYVKVISESDWGSSNTITIDQSVHKKGPNFTINVYCATASGDTPSGYYTTYGTITKYDWKAVVDASGNITLTTTTPFAGKVVLS